MTRRLLSNIIVDPVPAGEGIRVVLHPTEPRWMLVNDSGMLLLEAMRNGTSDAQLADVLCEIYSGLDTDQASMDVEDFLLQLSRTGLLEGSVPPPREHRPAPPPKITLYLTEQCNLRCKHCAIVEGRMPDPAIAGDDFRRIIGRHLAQHPGAEVSFLGGEPLLHPECMELLEFACARTETVSIGTNAILVDETVAAKLAALPIRIQVSVDGGTAETHETVRGRGTWEKTWRGIRLLTAAGAPVSVACVLTRMTVPEVGTLLALCDAEGLKKARFLPLQKQRAALTNWDALEPDPEDFRAVLRYLLFDAGKRPNARTEIGAGFPGYVPDPPAGRNWCPLGATLIVDSQGQGYVCPSLTTPDVQVGLVPEVDDGELAARQLRAREWMQRRVDTVTECRVCAWRNFCQGGCLAYMAHRSGSPVVNDEWCDFRRELYRENALRRAGYSPSSVAPRR